MTGARPDSAMPAMFFRLRDVRFIRYVLASVGALAVDMGCFLALLATGMWAAGASALAYGAGIAAHWLLSSRAVFVGNVALRGGRRNRQKALFVISRSEERRGWKESRSTGSAYQ